VTNLHVNSVKEMRCLLQDDVITRGKFKEQTMITLLT